MLGFRQSNFKTRQVSLLDCFDVKITLCPGQRNTRAGENILGEPNSFAGQFSQLYVSAFLSNKISRQQKCYSNST